MLARLRNYFLTGILIITPLGVTLAIAWWVVKFIDDVVIPLIPEAYNPARLLGELIGIEGNVPGLGILVLVAVVTVIGALAAGLLGRWFIRLSEALLNQMPVIRSLYSAIKQLLETVLRNQSDTFKQAVLLQYPRPGLWAIAFVTAKVDGELGRRLEAEHVSVFLPTTPNPTSGFLLFVPTSDVVELDMTVEEAVKMVISAGIVTPKEQLSGAERLVAGNITHAEREKSLYGEQSQRRR